MKSALVASLLALLVASAPAQADETTPADVIKVLVRQAIMENPEMIAEAIQLLEEKRRLEAETTAKKAMFERMKSIYEDPSSPVGGNLNGDATLVEFFDYRCGYCKSVHDVLMRVVKDDGQVKLVFKELPILGQESLYASRAALASVRQKKYSEFHDALMRFKGSLNEQAVLGLAKGLGIDIDRLKKDMASPEIEQAIKANMDLAQALGVRGTPGFVIGDRLLPGAVPEDKLRQLLADVRTVQRQIQR